MGGNIKNREIFHVCNVCLCQIIMNAYYSNNNNFICTQLYQPYIDLHDTKKLDKYIDKVQAANNNN